MAHAATSMGDAVRCAEGGSKGDWAVQHSTTPGLIAVRAVVRVEGSFPRGAADRVVSGYVHHTPRFATPTPHVLAAALRVAVVGAESDAGHGGRLVVIEDPDSSLEGIRCRRCKRIPPLTQIPD